MKPLKYKHITFMCILLTLSYTVPLNIYAQNKTKDTTIKKATRYFFQKKFEMAELLFQEELKKNPENEQAYSYLGDIFLNKKRYDGAIKLYKKALDLNPDNAHNYFRLGQAYYSKQDALSAIQNFKRAYQLNAKIKFSFYHIGLAYLMLLRDKQQTINNWQTYLQLAPEDPQYEKIRRVIELLKDPNFTLPPVGSDVSIEEALHLGGVFLKKSKGKDIDRSAGHEQKKTIKKIEEIYRDDDL